MWVKFWIRWRSREEGATDEEIEVMCIEYTREGTSTGYIQALEGRVSFEYGWKRVEEIPIEVHKNLVQEHQEIIKGSEEMLRILGATRRV